MESRLHHYLAAGCPSMQALSLFNRDAWQMRIRQHRFRLRDVSDMADSHIRHANMLFTKGLPLGSGGAPLPLLQSEIGYRYGAIALGNLDLR